MEEEGYRRGIRLFNERYFFDAHEVWEDVWRESSGPEKKFLQGLIQLAVAFHHHSTGNFVGARSLLERARKNLTRSPEDCGGIALTSLLNSMAEWREAIGSSAELRRFPKIHILNHEEHEVTRRKSLRHY